MGRMTDNDANVLSGIDDDIRTEILFQYLVRGQNMKDIAASVLGNYDDFASQTVSVVTRGYGFHQGSGRGRYRSVSYEIIENFVREYQPEDYNGGLDEGTFDDFLQDYTDQVQARQQRQLWDQQQAAEAERQRRLQAQQQAEAERQRQLLLKQQQEQERLRREAEARAERDRIAAKDRGEHIELMNKGFAALKREDYSLAKRYADQAFAIQPMVGLSYIYAKCAFAFGNEDEAAEYAKDAMENYPENSPEHKEMSLLYAETEGYRDSSFVRQLFQKGWFQELSWSTKSSALFSLTQTVTDHWSYPLPYFRINEAEIGLVHYAAQNLEKLSLNSTTLLKLAVMAVMAGNYEDGFLLLRCPKFDEGDLSLPGRFAYDALLGKCCFEQNDPASAVVYWTGHLVDGMDEEPLYMIYAYGFVDDLLSLRCNDRIKRELDHLDRVFNGELPLSSYMSTVPGLRGASGRGWRGYFGVPDDVDYIHRYDELDGTWSWERIHLDSSPLGELKERGKDLLRGFLGRFL